MTQRPLVTFALFTYNQERFVRQAVEGALAQTYEPLEIIFSDDCSTDRTFEIIEALSREYQGLHRVVLNRNELNLGVTEHVNRVVMQMAHGEIIVVAAGDDVSLPERTSRLLDEWTQGPRASAVLSGYLAVDSEGKTIERVSIGEPKALTDRIELMARLRKRDLGYLVGCTMSLSRDLFDRFGPLVIRDIEDGAIIARAGLLNGVRVIGDVLVKYRRGDRSATRGPGPVSSAVRFARMRQQTYLQTLVDLNRMKVSALAAQDECGALENRIRLLLFGQELIIWYLGVSRLVRLLLAPLVLPMLGWRTSKELLAVSFPGAYSLYSRRIRRRGA